MFLLRNANNTNKKSDNFEEEIPYVKMTAGFLQTATAPQNGRQQQSVNGKLLR